MTKNFAKHAQKLNEMARVCAEGEAPSLLKLCFSKLYFDTVFYQNVKDFDKESVDSIWEDVKKMMDASGVLMEECSFDTEGNVYDKNGKLISGD